MSIYNRKYDVLFCHNPKCAGSSMERREFLGGSGHWPIWTWGKWINGLGQIFKFGFVRNPLDRVVSAFFHEPNITRFDQNKKGFKKFLKKLKGDWQDPPYNYPSVSSLPYHHHFLPQWYFLCDRDKKIAVDFVGRFENLKEDWKTVCDKIGVSDELEHTRKSDHLPYGEYYTPMYEKIVRNIYKDDFKIFGYD
jgi:hypothetical protein